jgi:serine/threonine protein kinase
MCGDTSRCRNKMPFKGYVSLEGCSITEGAQKGTRKYCIGIFHPQRRDYFLDSGSPKTMQKWFHKFEEALGLHRSQVTMNDFDVLSVVGKGAAGTVYQVREKETQKIFAMKVISKSAIQDRLKVSKPSPGLSKEESMEKHWMVQSVKMERKILEAVNHPFIVRLFFAFQTAEKLCFVLDFVNGGELYTHIAREKCFKEDRARFYAGEIILALEYLHEMGIVYRDLKPENILLDSEGHLKLTDFGQSKGGIEPSNEHGDNRRSFSLVGSPYYMAPEIFLKEGHGFEADWWSLGVLIYEMLVGLPPFYNENTSLAYRKLLVEEVHLPHQPHTI